MNVTHGTMNIHEGVQGKEDFLGLVSFNLGEEEFAVDILKVREINRKISITQVPNAPSFVEGVMNLRGKVIPVIDLRKRLGLAPKVHDNNTRVIVVELDGKIVGFVVDTVREVLRIPRSITEAPPSLIANIESDLIAAVGKLEHRLLILLNLEKLLSPNEKLEFEPNV